MIGSTQNSPIIQILLYKSYNSSRLLSFFKDIRQITASASPIYIPKTLFSFFWLQRYEKTADIAKFTPNYLARKAGETAVQGRGTPRGGSDEESVCY